jgi:hypothetical protein
MKYAFPFVALMSALPASAETSRQLDAHEHGVGVLNVAFDRSTVAIAFEAPGADIVGFEYVASSAADHSAVDAALASRSAPLELFVIPDAAGCVVGEAQAELEGAHGHEEHEDGEHEHDEHEDGEHSHDEHGEHDEEHHEEHAEDGHDGEDDAAGHTEFHAEYTLVCEHPDALTEIAFAYFDAFPNAQEVDVQVITSSGAQAYEVERATPVLKLER